MRTGRSHLPDILQYQRRKRSSQIQVRLEEGGQKIIRRIIFQVLISHMPNRENEIATLFTRNIRVIESAFVETIIEAYSGKEPKEMDFSGKLFIINFDHLENKHWGASDFLAICQETSIVLLDNLRAIDLSDRNLSRRFILFIGTNFYNCL